MRSFIWRLVLLVGWAELREAQHSVVTSVMYYRRAQASGGMFFFTVNLLNRKSDLLIRKVDTLRKAFRSVQERHPFTIIAIVIMPDHLHTIWQLPEDDRDYAKRWNLIKGAFSRAQPTIDETIGSSRHSKRERGIWQRRYWEHQIRDDEDLMRHMDYIHYNPVKHGYVSQAGDWRYSSIHRAIERGEVMPNWGGYLADEGEFGE